MRIMGVDPGLSALGIGLIEKQGDKFTLIAMETVKTSPRSAFAERLQILYQSLKQFIEKHEPDALAMEKPIYCQNMKIALTLGQAGGMAILAAAQKSITVKEFTPLQVKKTITGSGRAGKEQVQKMVKVLLKLEQLPKDDHCSDALACALCYAFSEKALRLLNSK